MITQDAAVQLRDVERSRWKPTTTQQAEGDDDDQADESGSTADGKTGPTGPATAPSAQVVDP